jgi:hypothetical protein
MFPNDSDLTYLQPTLFYMADISLSQNTLRKISGYEVLAAVVMMVSAYLHRPVFA